LFALVNIECIAFITLILSILIMHYIYYIDLVNFGSISLSHLISLAQISLFSSLMVPSHLISFILWKSYHNPDEEKDKRKVQMQSMLLELTQNWEIENCSTSTYKPQYITILMTMRASIKIVAPYQHNNRLIVGWLCLLAWVFPSLFYIAYICINSNRHNYLVDAWNCLHYNRIFIPLNNLHFCSVPSNTNFLYIHITTHTHILLFSTICHQRSFSNLIEKSLIS
jgi:hypothetical protein